MTESLFYVVIGALLGIGLFVMSVRRLGRARLEEITPQDRVTGDRPLPKPFPKAMVVARYKRRKRRRVGSQHLTIAASRVPDKHEKQRTHPN